MKISKRVNKYGRTPQPKLLRLLAKHLVKNVKDTEFDMGEWCGSSSRCAFGHAPEVPEIRAEGLRFVKDEYGMLLRLRKKDEKRLWPAHNFKRAEFVFGLSPLEAERLFQNRRCSRATIARILRRLASKFDGKPA